MNIIEMNIIEALQIKLDGEATGTVQYWDDVEKIVSISVPQKERIFHFEVENVGNNGPWHKEDSEFFRQAEALHSNVVFDAQDDTIRVRGRNWYKIAGLRQNRENYEVVEDVQAVDFDFMEALEGI